jgi:medium-chain acyl-[acyl-carrier-protein] hydrolase
LTRRLASLGGTPAELLAEPELMERLLRSLRADYAWLDVYRYRQRPPLPVPILAFCGEQDAHATAEEMRQWRLHTAADFVIQTMPGGHFFPSDQRAQIAGGIETRVNARQ